MAASQWIFPPPASPSFFNSAYLDINIRTFINTSTSFWPAKGFGKSAAYHTDVISFKLPAAGSNQDYSRNLHCMPCRQKLESNDEALNWDACRYGKDDTLPQMLTITISNLTPNNDNSIVYNLNQNPSLPESTKDQSLMCLFGIPDSRPYDMTIPFRFVNAARKEETGVNTYIFNETQPEGKPQSDSQPPLQDPERSNTGPNLSAGAIAGIVVASVVGVLLLVTAIACCAWKRKTNKKNAAAAGKVDMSKDEEAAGDALPSYEAPPEYTETTRAGTK